MIACVVDANVLVAELRHAEPHYKEARQFLDYARKQNLSIAGPATLRAEVAGAVARGTGKPVVGEHAVRLLLARPALQLVAVDLGLAAVAAEIAARQKVRGYDAIYLALAERLSAPFVSFDIEVMRRAPAGVAVVPPAALLANLGPSS